MLVSIIIPAYNVEKYIAECLDSCLAQGLPNGEMEIIVVDDGSTDATPAILADYAARYNCIRLFYQTNQGQSVARNKAIEAAQGQYIYMVDSDDRMMADPAGRQSTLPLEAMQSRRYDIIGVQVWYQPEQGDKRPWSHQMEHWPFDQEFATGADFLTTHNIEGLVYGYVFNRRLFVQYPELRFTPGIYHQDEELIFKIFTLAQRTVYKRGYTYLYYEHSGSSINTRTEQRRRKLMDDYLTILHNLVAWRDRFGAQDHRSAQLAGIMHYKLSYLAMDTLRKLVRDGYQADYIHYFMDELRKLQLYPLPWLKEVKYLGIKLLTYHPRLVAWWAQHKSLNQKIGF